MRHPFYPIVYIRGYAGSQGEVEDTVADPYMGFNVGATKVRQRWTGDISRYVFESPLVRLMKDWQYEDVYDEGSEQFDGDGIKDRAVWIYRYYEPVSKDLGSGHRPEMIDYAKGLADFLARVRHAYTGDNEEKKKKFRVYLVAHSMGGLVARCYLQNIRDNYVARRPVDYVPGEFVREPIPVEVDKAITFATPHGGIDFRLIGNVPRFLRINNLENFNEKEMRKYLDISSDDVPVNSLDGKFPTRNFFSLIGTNAKDYAVSKGLARAAVGPMSDGLVQIKNAYADRTPRAFVHRAHSGHYGIVNSEEGYQNMTRFLFGDVRVDGKLFIDEVTLPGFAQRALDKGKKVRASYNVECIVRVRGADWDLHRRLTSEESAVLVRYDEAVQANHPAYLFSQYLSKAAIVSKSSTSMMFSLDLCIKVPLYEINGRARRDQFIRDGFIFRDKLNLRLAAGDETRLYYGWDSDVPNEARKHADMATNDSGWTCEMKIETQRDPRLVARLVLNGLHWNRAR